MKKAILLTVIMAFISQTLFAISATISDMRVENNKRNGVNGISFRCKVRIDDAINRKVFVLASVDSKPGQGVLDKNGSYRFANGVVGGAVFAVPPYSPCYLNEVDIWLPENELHVPLGTEATWYVHFAVVVDDDPIIKFNGDKILTWSDFISFGVSNKNTNTNTTVQQSNKSQVQKKDTNSPDYSYLLIRYSEYDKIKEDFGSVLRSVKEEYETQTIYRFYYDSGWEKILSISKQTCISCGGDGKLHNWYAPFPPPSNVCGRCNGKGKELPTIIARKDNSPYMYLENGEKMYSNYNAGNYNSGSSGDTEKPSSSSSNSLKRSVCSYCGGGGGCHSCRGTGHNYNSYSHREDTCPSCNGSGRCFNCRGTGRL